MNGYSRYNLLDEKAGGWMDVKDQMEQKGKETLEAIEKLSLMDDNLKRYWK